jgi:hypothetical protein
MEKKEKRIVNVEEDRGLNVQEERIKNSEILRIENFMRVTLQTRQVETRDAFYISLRSFANAKIRQYLSYRQLYLKRMKTKNRRIEETRASR